MCGIYGVYDSAGGVAQYRQWSEEASRLLSHRGPDGRACLSCMGGSCLLGHTRLAIIDLDGGAQPIGNEDETIWVILNGEIYNYIEIRHDLLAKGHRFRTHSDTEVLVHLYEEKGHLMLDDLDGMFAFAIVDQKKEQLFLARDRFGEKPLYYAPVNEGRGLVFASEMKALFPFPGLDSHLDVPAIAQFLAVGYVPAPRTHFRGVRKLMAGEALSVGRDGGLLTWRYWQPRIELIGTKAPSRQDAVESVRARVLESVRLRLRSDVPIGAFLSGGVDSTCIAAAIRELAPSAKFSTFCAAFDDQQLDESPYARLVAQHLETDHHEVHFSPGDLLAIFDELIDYYDEPFGDVSMFPTFAVCRAARQVCKVMLSGDGGDECFGGYTQMFAYHRWHGVRRTGLARAAAKRLRHLWRREWRGVGWLNFLSKSDWELVHPPERRNTITSYFLPEHHNAAEIGLEELEARALEHARLPYPLSAFEGTASSYLPEQIMVKVDRASMRASLECRAPFLNPELMNFATSLPVEYHFKAGMGKAILRDALPAWVPPEIRGRQKRGFTPPLCQWLRGELKTEMEKSLDGNLGGLRSLLNPSPARELFRQHLAGFDHSNALFRWLVLSRRCGEAVLN
ncbi:MAG TPA: asparagine synthase (glutamine-hydrolyzing) [Terriglobales bacterium]|nr:asparagine synthase (glutamine-hydrolyzing) [Terriglobales bacterium]